MPSYSQQLSRLAALFGGNQNSYGLPLANRNYIVDGNFDQWISSSVVLGVAGFTNSVSPMYYNYAGVGGNATISKNVPSIGTEPVGMTAPFTNAMLHNQTVASTGTFQTTGPYIQQLIESVRTLQGRSATVSMWLWCSSGTLTIPSIFVQQNFGTGGSPSSVASQTVSTNWVVTTTPQRFSVRVDIQAITGKTLGSNNNDNLTIMLPLPVGSTYSITTAQWQLEQSSPNAPAAGMPTAFEYRGQQAELARVQRYYEAGTMRQQVAAVNYMGQTQGFTTAKRAAPTLLFTDAVGAASKFSSGGTNGLTISTGGVTGTVHEIYMDAIPSSNLTAGTWWLINWTADARL
jgi:hypothetical protein